MNNNEAITTIQMIRGRRIMLMPRVRSTKGVVMKLIPPIKTAAKFERKADDPQVDAPIDAGEI